MDRLSGSRRVLSLIAVVFLSLAVCLGGCAPFSWPTPALRGKIAFESERDGNLEIYLMDADGSHQTNLTQNPAYDGWPAWSPR